MFMASNQLRLGEGRRKILVGILQRELQWVRHYLSNQVCVKAFTSSSPQKGNQRSKLDSSVKIDTRIVQPTLSLIRQFWTSIILYLCPHLHLRSKSSISYHGSVAWHSTWGGESQCMWPSVRNIS
jgi:hypothetical protein